MSHAAAWSGSRMSPANGTQAMSVSPAVMNTETAVTIATTDASSRRRCPRTWRASWTTNVRSRANAAPRPQSSVVMTTRMRS